MMYGDLDLDSLSRVEKFVGLGRELLARLQERHYTDLRSAASHRDAVQERPHIEPTTGDEIDSDPVSELIDVLSALEVEISKQYKLADPTETVRADERRRLAQYIHDDVGQELAAAVIRLGSVEVALREAISGMKSFRAEVDTVRDILSQIQIGLRDFSHDLHPSEFELLGLVDRLKSHVESDRKMGSEQQQAIAVRPSPGFPRFEPWVEKLLFRIVMEAVSNAVTHAHARTITVDLTTHGDVAQIAVGDDGVGFDVNEVVSQGIGLEGMSRRADWLGAQLEIVSRKRRGTVVTLSLPVMEQYPGPKP